MDGIAKRRFCLSWLSLFLLLSSYTMLRPLRDELSSRWGTEGLHLSFTATFVSMLFLVPVFGFLSNSLSRKAFLSLLFSVFSLGFLAFALGFSIPGEHPTLAKVFFTWVSVFNLSSISLVWSVINGVTPSTDAGKMFGRITTGAGLGAVLGPALTMKLVPVLGTEGMIFLAIGFLCASGVSTFFLSTTSMDVTPASTAGLKGTIYSGVRDIFQSAYYSKIALIVFLSNVVATMLYFQQADFFKRAVSDAAERAQLFAGTDLVVNILTLCLQLFATDFLIRRCGIAAVLLITPLLCILGFSVFWAFPVVSVLICFQVARRIAVYALAGPSKEVLFSVGSEEEKYKTKNCIDTLVYRTGDTLGSWVYVELLAMGAGLPLISVVNIGLCLLISGFALASARQFEKEMLQTTRS